MLTGADVEIGAGITTQTAKSYEWRTDHDEITYEQINHAALLMDCTAQGNIPAQQQIICEDLKKVTAPRAPKELYVSFTDTASYFKAQQETEPRRKNRRLERSGYETFVDNLNQFVAAKGVLQKINLPLNTIAAEIRKAAENFSAEDFSDLEELRREKKILVDSKRECLEDIDGINFKIDIAGLGRETAESATSKKK